MKMGKIANIYFNMGTLACSGHLHDFFTKNANALESAGFYYPDFCDPLDMEGQRASYSLISAALTSSQALDEYLAPLHKLVSQVEVRANAEETLVLSCPSLFRYAKIAQGIHGKLVSIFPEATIHYFGSFCRQHHEIAALCSLNALFSGRPLDEIINAYTRNPELLDYYVPLQRLQQHLPPPDLYFHLCHDDETIQGKDSLGKSALDAFLDTIGIAPSILSELERSAPAWLLSQMPREWGILTTTVNRNASASPGGMTASLRNLLPWARQMPHLMSCREKLSSMLTCGMRQQIYRSYASSNETFCKSVGGDVFAPPDNETARGNQHLTREKARAIVYELDKEFVENLRKTLNAIRRPDACEILFFQEACSDFLSAIDVKAEELSVDVLTLACNQENYVEECIKSVLSQQASFPVRHIIVDDASVDATPDIIARYASDYPDRIIPIFLQKKRKNGNVLNLFRACRSKYAALCDGDDYFSEPTKLQKQVDFLEANPDCSMCFHPVLGIYEDKSQDPFVFPRECHLPRGLRKKYYLAELLFINFIQTNSVVYRWRFREGLPDWFRPDLCPADWYWHLLHAETGKIGFLPQVMSVYRRHPASLFARSFQKNTSEHRRRHGMGELETYKAVNDHFRNRYFARIARLANSVFADFLQLQRADPGSGILRDALLKYPEFGQNFLEEVKRDEVTRLRREEKRRA